MKTMIRTMTIGLFAFALTACSTSSEMEEKQDPTLESQQTVQDESTGNEKVGNAAADLQADAETFRIESKRTLAGMKKDLDQLGNKLDAEAQDVEAEMDEGAEEAEDAVEEAQAVAEEDTDEQAGNVDDDGENALTNLRRDIAQLEAEIDDAQFRTEEEFEAFSKDVKERSQKIQKKIQILRNKADEELDEAVKSDGAGGDS
jgi:hypothetical protein